MTTGQYKKQREQRDTAGGRLCNNCFGQDGNSKMVRFATEHVLRRLYGSSRVVRLVLLLTPSLFKLSEAGYECLLS